MSVLTAASTPCRLARASEVPGMRAQTFHASYEQFEMFNFEANWAFHCYTCTQRLHAHPRHMTRASQLSCKRHLNIFASKCNLTILRVSTLDCGIGTTMSNNLPGVDDRMEVACFPTR